MTPQSDPPTFNRRDAELIRRAANATDSAAAKDGFGSASGAYLQPIRDIAGRVEEECESGSPSDFTKDDLAPLHTLAKNLRGNDAGIDPNKLTPERRIDREFRQDAASAADRIAAIITARLR